MKKDKGFVNCMLAFFLGGMCAGCMSHLADLRKDGKIKDGIKKDKKYGQLFDNWLMVMEKEKRIEEYFYGKGIREIAVYGYGNIGKHVIMQLAKSDITVKYIIDRKAGIATDGIECYSLSDDIPEVDAIVVTPICEYHEISKKIRDNILGEIISIEDIIYELL